MPLLLASLLACTNTPSAPKSAARTGGTFPDVQLARDTPAGTYQLYTDPMLARATFELADGNLPPNPVHTFEVGTIGSRVKIAALPFPLSGDARARIGTELEVYAGDKKLKYASLGGGSNTWKIVKDRLEIRAHDARTVKLVYNAQADLVKRAQLSASGLEPAAFVKAELTRAGDTRTGIMLPSPSTVSYELDLPKGAKFTASAGIWGAPASGQSDGVDVVLEVVEGETVTEVARRRLTIVKAEPFDADLSKWGGKKVTVRLRSEVFASPELDYVFIGAPSIHGERDTPPRRVVVIGFDTTRPDHFGWYGYERNTTPELDAIGNTSGVFTHAWTPAPRTRPSFRSATTGRNPLDAVRATNIGQVFRDNGFATAGFVANIHLQPRFDFHEGFDQWWFDGRALAHHQVERTLDFLKANEQRDAYVFMHVMDPHLLYHAPDPYTNEFVPEIDPDLPRAFTKSMVKQWMRNGTLTDLRKNHIEGLYDGELRFTSAQIGKLIRELDKLPGDTLVVLHNDHGEEFWEHGGFEHNHTLVDEVTRGLLWVRPPGGTKGGAVTSEMPATLADIAPTLYDYMGFQDTPKTDGISLRPYLEGKAPEPRDIGIAHLRHGTDRWAVVHDGYKYTVNTASGVEELYKLPDEKTDLAEGSDLAPYREALLGVHPGLRGGIGWRLRVQGMPAFTLTLPKKAQGAGILDPDWVSSRRVNLAWGEPPLQTLEDVGQVTLSEDGTTLSYTPGPKPDGIVYVEFGAEVDPTGMKMSVDGNEDAYKSGTGYVGATGAKMRIASGFVIVPPPGEAARMEIELTGEARSDDETCRLCELGYMEGEACEECDGE